MPDEKCVAKYLRLSLEDDDVIDESNSITNQRIVLSQYIANCEELKGMNVLEFKDDGYSGTNFNRPGFQEMMLQCRKGKISTIIVKDLSRFGRNHIEVDTYLEQIFPFLGIRFIAVNDNIDSKSFDLGLPGMDVGFRNIINEHHSVDTSQKVKCSFRERMKAGKYMGARAPYGYIKPDEDVTSLVINPETAPIVQRIFHLYVSEDYNITQIARWLNENEIMCPGQYKKEVLKTGVKNTTNRFIWYPTTVRLILTTETYLGKTVGGKWKVATVGSNKHVKTEENEWIVVEGTHEAIISRELFERAQEKLEKRSRKKRRSHTNNYPLKGKLVCGGCGQKLVHISRCNPHVKCPRKFNSTNMDCLRENLYDEELNSLVLRAIKLFASIADGSKLILEGQRNELRKTVNSATKLIRRCEDQINRLKHEKSEQYMRYALEEITENDYLQKTEELDKIIADKENEAKHCKSVQEEATERLIHFPRASKGCLMDIVANENELTKELVDEFIKEVKIFADKRIEIEWNFADELIRFVDECKEKNLVSVS